MGKAFFEPLDMFVCVGIYSFVGDIKDICKLFDFEEENIKSTYQPEHEFDKIDILMSKELESNDDIIVDLLSVLETFHNKKDLDYHFDNIRIWIECRDHTGYRHKCISIIHEDFCI